jgi:hypothetical protein
MAGVFGQLIRSQKRAMSQKAMELEAAREILAEVFSIKLSEVDEMIQNRFQADDTCIKENGSWPQELWIDR